MPTGKGKGPTQKVTSGGKGRAAAAAQTSTTGANPTQTAPAVTAIPTVQLPPTQKSAAPEKKANPKDPVEIQVLRSALPEAGKFRLIARVLNYKGDGIIGKKVGFVFRGKLVEVDTSASGVCQFPKTSTDPISIKPGAEEKITAFVSGISELTTTNVCRRRKPSARSKADAQKNNQRARIFFAGAGIAFAAWIIAAFAILSIFGLGEPLLGNSHELSGAEKLYNTLPSVVEASQEITGDSGQGRWQKTIIFFPLGLILLWTLFAFLYGIISLREEVAEAWRASIESLVDRHYVKAHDPLFERVMAWSGHLARARVQNQGTAPVVVAENQSKKAGFWNYFSSDILSELIMDVIPRIFRTIVGGKK